LLREKAIEADEINYAKSGLDEPALRAIVKAAGSVAAVLNTRHAVAKERGWDEKPPSIEEFVRAVARDMNVLKRPILIRGKTVLIGFQKSNQEAWQKLG
jgi:arsenate reductase-like glutaredoxin family protein